MRAWATRRRFPASRPLFLWVTCAISATLILLAMFLYGFLAVNHPIGEGILVVDAWIPEATLAASANVFQSGRYRYLIVVGGPQGEETSRFDGPAANVDLAAAHLESLGVDPAKLIRISVPNDSLGRTFGRAVAVRQWLDRSGVSVCCADVFTVGVHARKNWILFRHALGGNYRVGIISGPEVRYNPRFWFASRAGIWVVIRNLAGYLYSRAWILFDGKGAQSLSGTDFQSPRQPGDSVISREQRQVPQSSEQC